MRRAIFGAVVAMALCSSASHAADDYDNVPSLEDMQIEPKDACTVFLCMSEKLYGEHSRECEPAINYFYSLKRIGRHGFDPGKTLQKRQNALEKCPAADPAHVSKILNKFGRLRS